MEGYILKTNDNALLMKSDYGILLTEIKTPFYSDEAYVTFLEKFAEAGINIR